MQRNGGGDDSLAGGRTSARRIPIGNPLGPLPEGFTATPQPPLWQLDEVGGQLGRKIILAAERGNFGNMPSTNLPFATRRSFSTAKSVQDIPIQRSLTGSPAPTPFAPPARLNGGRVGQTPERSLFDIAGRFYDFRTGPKIARPNLAEEFIPVVGPAWDAVADFQDGSYGSAALNAGMALGDLLPVGYGIKAGRGALRLVREMGTLTPKAAAIQRKIHKIGLALPSEDVHHIFELNGLGRYVPNWKNNPLLLKVLPREVHQRLHRSWGGNPKFGLIPRLYHGTTDWMKAGAAGVGSYAADRFENVERLLTGNSEARPQRVKPAR